MNSSKPSHLLQRFPTHLPLFFPNLVPRVNIVTGTPTGNRPLGRPRPRWENNIRVDLKEMGIGMRNWVDSAQDRDYWITLVNAALNLRIP